MMLIKSSIQNHYYIRCVLPDLSKEFRGQLEKYRQYSGLTHSFQVSYTKIFNLFQQSVAFHIENSQLIFSAGQMNSS